MRHPIDPKVDCVFKALLGSDENRDLLIHFLNAILGADLPRPIAEVELVNPYNDKEFLDDKLSVVDVKAKDGGGHLYQIEVQMQCYGHLPQRIAYAWCDIYSAQLKSGEGYPLLRPTYAVWLLGETLVRDDPGYYHDYRLRDRQGRPLLDNGGIYLLELTKFQAEPVETDRQRWLKFFKDGEALDDATLPDWMNSPEMRKAMSVLKQFSEKERDYYLYQARQNYLREQRTIRWEYEQNLAEARQREQESRQREEEARQCEEEARQREEESRQREQVALEEIERLKALLAEKEIQP